MNTMSGVIENICYMDKPEFETQVVHIKPAHNENAFIEFRNRELQRLKLLGLKNGMEISARVRYEANVSPRTGMHYNNIIVTHFEIIR